MKPNFFKAVGAVVLLWRGLDYWKRQKELFNKWTVNVLALRFVRADFKELQLKMVLDFENKSAGGVEAGYFDFDVFLDGQKVARAVSSEFAKVGAYSSATLDFDVFINFGDAGKIAKNILAHLGQLYKMRVRLDGAFLLRLVPGLDKTVHFSTDQEIQTYL